MSLGACNAEGGKVDLAYIPAQAQCTPFDVMADPQQSDAEPVDDVDADGQEPRTSPKRSPRRTLRTRRSPR